MNGHGQEHLKKQSSRKAIFTETPVSVSSCTRSRSLLRTLWTNAVNSSPQGGKVTTNDSLKHWKRVGTRSSADHLSHLATSVFCAHTWIHLECFSLQVQVRSLESTPLASGNLLQVASCGILCPLRCRDHRPRGPADCPLCMLPRHMYKPTCHVHTSQV